jgi:hypothetical protein
MESNKQNIIYGAEHLKVLLPPEEAYFYFPGDFEIVEVDKKNPDKILRRIFDGKNSWLKTEVEKLTHLYQEIEKHNNTAKPKKGHVKLSFPSWWRENDTLRFHQATGYKSHMTIQLLIDHLAWRQSYFPLSITPKAIELLNSGFIYVHGRDHLFRPIFIVNAKFYVDNMDKYIYDDWLACIIYFMEYMIKNLLIPGQVENWNIISDVCGVSLLGLPKDMKRFMNVLQSNYRNRLFVNFIYGMGTFLGLLWNMVKVFLDEISLRKIRMLKKGQFKDILLLVNPEQLEQKYGGTAPDVKENFFPPIFPSNNYLKSPEDKSKLLVSEEVYARYLNTKVVAPSPYYLEKQHRLSIDKMREKSKTVDIKQLSTNSIKDTFTRIETIPYKEDLAKSDGIGFVDIEKLVVSDRSQTGVKDEIDDIAGHKRKN